MSGNMVLMCALWPLIPKAASLFFGDASNVLTHCR
ncbi:hypothetical protein DVU_2265 [Nitratidesulfovibrio vulgaris str. Hildenborough]|uniref:Uncharacterized protein n=1 Tax=Nitratidesulfovibrio vulgaris (strain ATCC 29579 / DSM 644 / CCUG 34227 / NCIMB 8303 / VKM B-1760 / Hildenborough) TaxID=882 RepID=Q729T4_NITV2|nr:hypothetical protein DVU_2265 [Nitratidesulfovibrio vulgaris str. Hildenborough]